MHTKRANVLKPRTNPTCASIIAWCIAPALTNAGLEFGSYPAHIGLEIPVRPAAGCCCHRYPFWPSQTMTIGAASGPLRLLEISCLLHFFCLSKLTNRSIHFSLLCILRLMTQMQNSLFKLCFAFMAFCVCETPSPRDSMLCNTCRGTQHVIGTVSNEATSGMGRED